MGCLAPRALGLVPVLARPGRRGYGGFKTETALVWRAGFRLPYALADRKTKNAPEWFRGVGFALAVVVGMYLARSLRADIRPV